MDLSFASKAAQAKAQIADALKRMPPAPPPGAAPAPAGALPQPAQPQAGAQAPVPPVTPPQGSTAAPMSPLAVMGMQPQAQPALPQPQQAPNLAVPRAFAKGGKVRKPRRSLAVQIKGN